MQALDVYVDALNSSGSVCESSFAYQNDYSTVLAIHIKHSDIPSCALPSGSLQIRYVVCALPTGTTKVVYNSELWDNESGY